MKAATIDLEGLATALAFVGFAAEVGPKAATIWGSLPGGPRFVWLPGQENPALAFAVRDALGALRARLVGAPCALTDRERAAIGEADRCLWAACETFTTLGVCEGLLATWRALEGQA